MMPRTTLLAIGLLTCGCSSTPPDAATASEAALHRGGSTTTCPPPTEQKKDGVCTLSRDVQLATTLRLPSNTRLNCKGHSILPSIPGVDGVQADFRPSTPEVAILLDKSEGVVIQNCTIGAPSNRFDFGVVIAGKGDSQGDEDAPAAARNRVLSNVMYVRARGVQAFLAGNNQISDNVIEYSGSRAIAVHLHGTSFTKVTDNIVSGLATPLAMYHRGVPGVERQLGCAICGLLSIYPSQAFPVINIIVDGQLLQFPNEIDGQSRGNVFEGNRVSSPPAAGGIYVAVRAVDTLVRDNDVTGGVAGIVLAGFPMDTFLLLPGTCSGDPARSCGVTTGTGIADHCSIPGIDATPKGTCTVRADCGAIGGAAQPNGTCRVDGLDGRAVDTRVQGNRVEGQSATGISTNNQLNPTIERNLVRAMRVAIEVATRSLEHGEISRNDLEAAIGFSFGQNDAQRFGIRILLNDVNALTPIEAGGGGGTCSLGIRRPCAAVADCDTDFCRVDGRCHLSNPTRCETDSECTTPNQCVMFSHEAELSVGHCSLDRSVPCSADADCTVGACAGEPTRRCRHDSECHRADFRTPSAGMCGGLTSAGTCTRQRGNHWGRSCEDSDGFRDAGEEDADSQSPLITDRHPYGEPVSSTPSRDLPPTCF